jgi:hypothetical protein
MILGVSVLDRESAEGIERRKKRPESEEGNSISNCRSFVTSIILIPLAHLSWSFILALSACGLCQCGGLLTRKKLFASQMQIMVFIASSYV